ncbi:hypothetical protein OUZ56_003250 [Daphnia magna]|uniref:Uncharacterized protein n=1 Tax=Daphnia magna TaxID=35525 RepID=A0ABR0A864_9CRUS|nr:hypothetical protein OUZ56_003250 [Daphnia magna]
MNSKKIQHELRVFATSQEIIDVTMITTDDEIVAQWKTTQNNRPTEQLGYQPNVQSAPTVPFSPVTQQLNQQLAISQQKVAAKDDFHSESEEQLSLIKRPPVVNIDLEWGSLAATVYDADSSSQTESEHGIMREMALVDSAGNEDLSTENDDASTTTQTPASSKIDVLDCDIIYYICGYMPVISTEMEKLLKKFSIAYELRPSGKLKHRLNGSSQAYGTDFSLHFVVCV